jgi:hypothetical protein
MRESDAWRCGDSICDSRGLWDRLSCEKREVWGLLGLRTW